MTDTIYKYGSPLNSKKHHLFANGESRSVCGKWLFFGEQYGEVSVSTFGTKRDDCAACAKQYAKARGLSGL